ncbi:MAG: Membrane domain of glycerophosphoryl diester phosphodiesterase [Streptosporangiaceae bacterium]|nr:Membrane domain of glycerophosphoryl diester phosphodiesterase [Streptosporangiaceae bacterium]
MKDPQAWAIPGSGVSGPAAAPDGGASPVAPASGSASPEPRDRSTDLVIDRSELLGGDIPLRPLGVSEILDGAIGNIRRNPRAVLGLSLIICSVIQVLVSVATYVLIGDGSRGVTPTPVLRTLGAQATMGSIGLVLSAFGVLLLAGLLAPVMGRSLFGLPTTLREAWRHARPQALRLLGVSLAIMAISVLALGLPILPLIAFAATGAPAVVGVLSGVIGVPLGLVAMIWLYVLFVLAAPAVVMERRGVLASMRRAHRLVRRRWWRTCGALLVTLLITLFMGLLALRIPFVVVQLVAFGDNPTGGALVLSLAVDTLGRIVGWALMSPFDAGVIALFYVDQRMRREGLDLELQTRPQPGRIPADFLELWKPSPLVPDGATTPAPVTGPGQAHG